MNTLEANSSPTSAYHELVAIEDLQANGNHSLALRLLPEILAIILFFHAEANPTNPEGDGIIPKGMTPGQFRLGWITVTHVCRFWRQVALDFRNLWTYHRFNLGLEWTTEMLRRAGDFPLDLTFSEAVIPFPPSELEDKVEYVIPKLLSRASALTIGERACTHVVLNTLTQPAPLLSSLTINSPRFDVLPRFLFGDIAPKLRHLSLRNALPTWSAVALTHLESLSIRIDRHTDTTNIPSHADLLNALQAMPNLEALMLSSCLPLGPFPHCLEDTKVHIPKLRDLRLSGHVQGFRHMLEHLDFPPETTVRGSCITDDLTGKECCDVLPLLLSYLPRPSLQTLDVSWGSQFDRNFNIKGYSTSHEEEKSGKPCFVLEANPCFTIEFKFKFLLWSAEQKLRILKTVCSALPTDELRVLSGKLDLGKDAWSEIFGGHQELRHIRICSLSTLDSLLSFLGREEVYPKLVSLTLRDMDLLSKQDTAVSLLIDKLKTGRPPKMSKIFIETCRVERAMVDSMRAAVSEIEIQWDEVHLPGSFQTSPGITRRL